MTFGSPIGSFVYLIFPLIDDLSLAPVASTENANDTRAVSESNGQNSVCDTPEAEVPLLLGAVPRVFSDNAVRIAKGMLRQHERHAVLGLVLRILATIPFEARLCHATTLLRRQPKSHINVWQYVWPAAIEAVAAPESASNVAATGATVPMLTLGIPGSATTAIMLGAASALR